jgi:hypothetical protein
MTIDTVSAPNVKVETKQGVPAVQQQCLAASELARALELVSIDTIVQ